MSISGLYKYGQLPTQFNIQRSTDRCGPTKIAAADSEREVGEGDTIYLEMFHQSIADL